MTLNAKDLRTAADARRDSHDYDDAGNVFTQAFHRYFGETAYGEDLRSAAVGQGLYCLLGAALCYRLSGNENRAQNRARQGVLTVTDLGEYVATEPALAGLMYEYRGDFESVDNRGDPGESYARAVEAYEKADNLAMWQGEPSFEWNYAFFVRVVDASTDPLGDYSTVHSDPLARVEYKRENMAGVARDVVDAGQWEFDTAF